MPDNQTIKYQYALDAQGEIIDIKNAVRDDYQCIACGKKLIPAMGKIKQWHFKHKEKLACSPETYLHKLGKYFFENEYKNCLATGRPFYVEGERTLLCNRCGDYGPCQIGQGMVKDDLTLRFKEVCSEIQDGEFVPDILLRAFDGSKLFIEIAVTHDCSKEKVQSGNQIIEIKIRDEKDFNSIFSCLLSESTDNIRFYNIENLTRTGDFSDKCIMNQNKQLKLDFKDIYEACTKDNEKFEIRLDHPATCNHCDDFGPCEMTITKCYDLVELYPKVVLDYGEAKNYIPELFIESTRDRIYIDFVHSSKSKNYNRKTIIVHADKNEGCSAVFRNRVFVHDDKFVKFYNFNPQKMLGCFPDECRKEKYILYIKSDGSVHVELVKNYILEHFARDGLQFIKHIPIDSSIGDYLRTIEKCFRDGMKIRNCHICRHHKLINDWQQGAFKLPIYCKYHTCAKDPTIAINCGFFEPDGNLEFK